MKKLLAGITSLALCLSLTACGGDGKKAFDPSADAETLLNSGAFSEALTEIDQDTACLLYGIDASTVTACAVYGSTGATAEELAIFTLKDSDAAGTALSALQLRVEDRTEALASYLPNEITKLQSAVTEARGSSVLLVIAADYGPVDTFLEG
ncbi:hypothetical protein CE91St43_28630 [Oscillospiraceae bacterium]|nr:hypothetical protein CE91St43_28630 [Oscillospiraceae bacterium]